MPSALCKVVQPTKSKRLSFQAGVDNWITREWMVKRTQHHVHTKTEMGNIRQNFDKKKGVPGPEIFGM